MFNKIKKTFQGKSSTFQTVSPNAASKQIQAQNEQQFLNDQREFTAHLDKTLTELTIQKRLKEQDVQRTLENTRKLYQSPLNNDHEKRRALQKLKLQLGQFWYTRSLCDQLEVMSDQVKMIEQQVEFGKTIQDVNQRVKHLNRYQVDIRKLSADFIKQIKPLGIPMMDNPFDEMFNALVEASAKTTGTNDCTDALLEGIINGTTSWASPPITREPVATAQSVQQPVAKPAATQPVQQPAASSEQQILDAIERMTAALRS